MSKELTPEEQMAALREKLKNLNVGNVEAPKVEAPKVEEKKVEKKVEKTEKVEKTDKPAPKPRGRKKSEKADKGTPAAKPPRAKKEAVKMPTRDLCLVPASKLGILAHSYGMGISAEAKKFILDTLFAEVSASAEVLVLLARHRHASAKNSAKMGMTVDSPETNITNYNGISFLKISPEKEGVKGITTKSRKTMASGSKLKRVLFKRGAEKRNIRISNSAKSPVLLSFAKFVQWMIEDMFSRVSLVVRAKNIKAIAAGKQPKTKYPILMKDHLTEEYRFSHLRVG
jgi:hypothetical protein